MQAALPIWVGGQGEKRTLRIAARWADGWNVPFVDPTTFARKRDVLLAALRDAGRDPAEIAHGGQRRAGLDRGEPPQHQFGGLADYVRPGVLTGSDRRSSIASAATSRPAPTRSTWRCGRPFDEDALDRFAGALHLT